MSKLFSIIYIDFPKRVTNGNLYGLILCMKNILTLSED